MTNHPKFTESHDSAARDVGYEWAREIRKPLKNPISAHRSASGAKSGVEMGKVNRVEENTEGKHE